MKRPVYFAVLVLAASLLATIPTEVRCAPLAINTCPPDAFVWPNGLAVKVNGTADGEGWSWCINGPDYSVCDTNVLGLAPGSSADSIVGAIAASINASGCPGILARQHNYSGQAILAIHTSCVLGYSFCIGPAGSTPVCCLNLLSADSCLIGAMFAQLQSNFCSLCGDANNTTSVNISDAIYLIGYIFAGGAAPRYCHGNANGDCIISISDVVFIINYVFGGGPTPSGCW